MDGNLIHLIEDFLFNTNFSKDFTEILFSIFIRNNKK